MASSSVNDSGRNNKITVEALSHSREFADVADLGAFVASVIEDRGGIFDPFELSAISKLAQLANGEASSEVHRIARATAFHSPSRSPRGKTPFDEKISEAEERVSLTEEARQVALDGRQAVLAECRRCDATATGPGAEADILAAYRRVAASDEVVGDATDSAEKALATRNALELASQRWRYGENLRFHNVRDPGSSLTREEFDAQVAAEIAG